ncbi:inorganic pyrophosphatase 1-like [Carica papaya]|uniref:inorganic pyrophosphatase 1-like n=1 Tax=Carica papaya TaxID=3649 RepID=UPI000B8CC875|nr:inorganic pyrophosphatase 1-like [Carica papaya]
MMKELHSQGKTMEDIEQVLKRTPIHPRVIPAIESAFALGCELRIVSDANMFFIETILKHHGIRDYFSEINTNPGFVDGQGRLRIFPYHDFTCNSPHGCINPCPPNMCKGLIIERIQASLSMEGKEKKKMIYLGDGAGDYCPSLKLNEGDYVMPRKNFPVWDLISKNTKLVKAEIHEWSNGEELEYILLQIIDKIYMEEEEENICQLISGDYCKFKTISVVEHETLPKVLPVPQ